LYGATNDGSAASLEDDIYVALKEAVRFLALNPDVRIRFDGGTHTHAAFRDGLGKKLKEIFPDRDVTRPVEKVATVKLEESASDSAGDATRSVADKNANLTAESSSDKKTIVKPRKDASEENRSIGSRGSNSNADSSEDFRSEAGSEAESFDDRTEEARRTMESRGGFSQREKLEFDLKKPIEEGKRLVNAEPEAEGSGEQEPYKRKRMDGAKISRHPSWEGKYLPDLFSASVEGKNPAEKTKGLKSEGSKRGKISIFGRGVKLARNLINKKPVANEGGRKQPVSVGLPSVGSSSPDVGNIFVHGYQVSSVKGAGAKLEEYKEGLAALVGTLLKHWRDIEKPREIYVGKLSHDTEALSTAMKTFLLRINKLASDNCDLNVTAEIGEVKAWVEMWMESVEEVDRNVFGMHSSRDRYDENALTKHMNDFVRLLQDMEQSASAIKGDRIDVASSPKGVRKLVGEKSVEKEKGKKATSSRTPVVNVKEKGVTFPDNISRINEYGSNPSLLDERRPKVRRRSLDAESRISKSDRQVSPPKGPEYELARYKKHLALLAGPLLDHWTKVLESTEIDADRLLKDVESFSPSMEEFLSKVSHLESGSVSGKAGIKADKSWARDCRNEIGNIQIDLSIFYFEGDSGDKEELRTLLVRFVKLLKDVAE
jgi:hypothetical protein